MERLRWANYRLPSVGTSGFQKCGAHSVETIHKDRNSGPPTLSRPQRSTKLDQDYYLRLPASKSDTTVSQPV
ncbi:hypothetical protein TNCV_721521 [Trichonephila clavipes]|nr:hypothetical protein TNCV_721521 [Trichonephila clavipes]